MFIIVSALALLFVTIVPEGAYTQPINNKETIKRFCMSELGQSKFDTTHCLLKPSGYGIGGGKDPAVLTYMCCLGHFRDVTYNYMPYVSSDLVMMIVNSNSAVNLISAGTFISKCSRRRVKVTRKDFDYWNRKGRTQRVCKSPQMK
ncbi:hypothetical protein ElyMa_003953300 [Elysia marginata]|uniref:Uncharacterized protein n=1 Tax=Elysia marginata TaxID=1093978 RepID=A0AAV4FU84_9GAST|nr:hypothetical protein ElyMa_003953300 [Elysia marginata]